MAETVIGYKLVLAVKLIDTTTGRFVSERGVAFFIDGLAAEFSERMAGVYIRFCEGTDATQQKDMELEVVVKGYRTVRINVSRERLAEQYPTVEIPLIPDEKKIGYSNLAALNGIMEGIEDIEAVSIHASLAEIVSYNVKKQIMKLLYAGTFEEERYAVLHEQQNTFEVFRIAGRKGGMSLKLQTPLETNCHTGEIITRIVRGAVDKDGGYLLRVRRDGFGTEYLVKYTVKGNVKFKRILFDYPEERRLE